MAIKNKTEALIAIQLFKEMLKKTRIKGQEPLPVDRDKCLEILLNSNAYKDVVVSEYAGEYVSLKWGKAGKYNIERHLYKGGNFSGTCYGYSYDPDSWLMGVRKATCLSEVIQLFPTFVHAH